MVPQQSIEQPLADSVLPRGLEHPDGCPLHIALQGQHHECDGGHQGFVPVPAKQQDPSLPHQLKVPEVHVHLLGDRHADVLALGEADSGLLLLLGEVDVQVHYPADLEVRQLPLVLRVRVRPDKESVLQHLVRELAVRVQGQLLRPAHLDSLVTHSLVAQPLPSLQHQKRVLVLKRVHALQTKHPKTLPLVVLQPLNQILERGCVSQQHYSADGLHLAILFPGSEVLLHKGRAFDEKFNYVWVVGLVLAQFKGTPQHVGGLAELVGEVVAVVLSDVVESGSGDTLHYINSLIQSNARRRSTLLNLQQQHILLVLPQYYQMQSVEKAKEINRRSEELESLCQQTRVFICDLAQSLSSFYQLCFQTNQVNLLAFIRRGSRLAALRMLHVATELRQVKNKRPHRQSADNLLNLKFAVDQSETQKEAFQQQKEQLGMSLQVARQIAAESSNYTSVQCFNLLLKGRMVERLKEAELNCSKAVAALSQTGKQISLSERLFLSEAKSLNKHWRKKAEKISEEMGFLFGELKFGLINSVGQFIESVLQDADSLAVGSIGHCSLQTFTQFEQLLSGQCGSLFRRIEQFNRVAELNRIKPGLQICSRVRLFLTRLGQIFSALKYQVIQLQQATGSRQRLRALSSAVEGVKLGFKGLANCFDQIDCKFQISLGKIEQKQPIEWLSFQIREKDEVALRLREELKEYEQLNRPEPSTGGFNCAISDGILLNGRLHVQEDRLIFRSLFNTSNIFFGQSIYVILGSHIKAVEKQSSFFVPNGLKLSTSCGEVFFSFLLSRETVLQELLALLDRSSQQPLVAPKYNYFSDEERSKILGRQQIQYPIPAESFVIYTKTVKQASLPLYFDLILVDYEEQQLNPLYESMLSRNFSEINIGKWGVGSFREALLGSRAQFKRVIKARVKVPKVPMFPDSFPSQELQDLVIVNQNKVVLASDIRTQGVPFADKLQCILTNVFEQIGSDLKITSHLVNRMSESTFFDGLILAQSLKNVKLGVTQSHNSSIKQYRSRAQREDQFERESARSSSVRLDPCEQNEPRHSRLPVLLAAALVLLVLAYALA